MEREPINLYGPRVVGKDAFAVAQDIAHEQQATYGSKVMDAAPAAADAPVTVTLTRLRALLVEQPLLLDELVLQEMSRADGPRPTAVAMLRQAAVEQGKDEAYLAGIDALIAPSPVDQPEE